jgi:hypothetical protein
MCAELAARRDRHVLTIEWVMTLLLNNPYVPQKATIEIHFVVGTSRLLQESNLVGLPYICCVITETL